MDHHEGFFVGSFTMALFAATFFLWRSTDKLYLAGERQIAQAQRSADAAVQSAEAAQASLTRLERPYLFIQIEEVHHRGHTSSFSQLSNPPMIDGHSISIDFVLANHGKSPAIIEFVVSQVEFRMKSEGDYPVDADAVIWNSVIGKKEKTEIFSKTSNSRRRRFVF